MSKAAYAIPEITLEDILDLSIPDGVYKAVPSTKNLPQTQYGKVEIYSDKTNQWRFVRYTTTQPSRVWITFYNGYGSTVGWNDWEQIATKSDLSDLVKWVGISIPIGSLAAGAEKYNQSFEFVLDDGYASAALAGFTLNGIGYTSCSITQCFLLGHRVKWSVRNLGTSATGDDLKLNCQVMLIKQAFAG